MMRVITGTAKGVRLDTLDGETTRPTSERTKEAMFSMIQFEIEGRRVKPFSKPQLQETFLRFRARGYKLHTLPDFSSKQRRHLRNKNTESYKPGAQSHFQKAC